MGVTEETEAVSVVVSEETGTVSVGVGGRLWRDFDTETLKLVLNGLFVQGLPSVEAVFGEEEESDGTRTCGTRCLFFLRIRRPPGSTLFP